jgi:hypothetical protein
VKKLLCPVCKQEMILVGNDLWKPWNCPAVVLRGGKKEEKKFGDAVADKLPGDIITSCWQEETFHYAPVMPVLEGSPLPATPEYDGRCPICSIPMERAFADGSSIWTPRCDHWAIKHLAVLVVAQEYVQKMLGTGGQ